jgi:anti-sigma factor RsiW
MMLFDPRHSAGGEPCARWRGEIQERLDERLPPAERARLAAHLNDCPACRRYQASLEVMRSALAAMPVANLPDEALRAVRDHRFGRLRTSLRRPAPAPRMAAWPAAIAAAILLALLIWPAGETAAPGHSVEQATAETETTLRLVGHAFERIEQVAMRRVLEERLAPALRRLPFRLQR